MRDPLALRIEHTLRNPLVFWPAVLLLAVGGALVLWLLTFIPLVRDLLASQFWFSIILMAVVLFLMLQGTALCIFAERKVSAYVQDRHGPNRQGPMGLLQSIADGLKLLLKEDVIPGNVDKPIYLLAPCLSFIIGMIGFAVIPWAGDIRWPWMEAGDAVKSQIADLDIGFLYIVAVASLGVYGVVLAGYASNNKYAAYGGMRAAAQMVSYEIPLGLGLLCILLTVGTLRLDGIVEMQARSGLWFIFYQPLAFILVMISAFAETNRAPFDLAEAEQELVGGFHTEYSALKFGLFFLGEYAHMITGSALMIALFLGGWSIIPFTNLLADDHEWWAGLIKFGVYWFKIALFIGFFMLVRWTLPRFRFDQLMKMAWQGMVPAGVALVLGTALLVVWNLHDNLFASLAMNIVVLVLALIWAGLSRTPITGRQENLPELRLGPPQGGGAVAGS